MAWVYILRSKSGKYYVGSTIDLDKRLKHHLGGHTYSTKRMHIDTVILTQEYKTLKDARSIEKKIKDLKRRDYIEKMLKDGYIRLIP